MEAETRAIPADGAGAPAARDLGRGLALALLLALVPAAFALRIWNYRAYLPNVFYSDYVQITQAAELLKTGSFTEQSSYPVTHTYVYAFADLVAYRWGQLTGGPDWDTFVTQLASDDVSYRHAIGRAYTAFVGSFLPLAVYLLARTAFSRKVALLAAAFAAFSPAHVIYGHQPRIHVPGILLLTLAAVPVVRCIEGSAGWRRALAAGAACAAVAAIFQFGFFLLTTAVGLLVFGMLLRRRTLGRTLALIGAAGAGFAGTLGAVHLLTHLEGVVVAAKGSGTLENVGTLGIPGTFVSGASVARFFERFPMLVVHWAAAEPMVALGFLGFATAALARRRRRDALFAFSLYPLLMFLVLGTTYSEVRYSLSALPFLGILAADFLLDLRPAAIRFAAVAAAVALPLASSWRYDGLLDRADSRLFLHAMIPALASNTIKTAIDDPLILPPPRLAPGVVQFPPKGNYALVTRGGIDPGKLLDGLEAQVFVGVESSIGAANLRPNALEALGYRNAFKIPAGSPNPPFLPDASDWVIRDLWCVARPGPTILFWAKSPAAARHLAEVLPPGAVVRCEGGFP
jgi:dolichyl-phosphate-mannose-protein mannosyltransferase